MARPVVKQLVALQHAQPAGVHPVHACTAPFAFGDDDYLLVLIYWHPFGTCWYVAAAVCVCLCGAGDVHDPNGVSD